MLILAGGIEYLRDHAILAYYAARAAGVDVKIVMEPNLGHVYPSYSGIAVVEGHEGLGKIASFVRDQVFDAAVDHLLRPLPDTVDQYVAQFGSLKDDAREPVFRPIYKHFAQFVALEPVSDIH